jgi:chromosome segregation protein
VLLSATLPTATACASLTGQSFACLALDYREDVLTLAAARADGQRVPIAGLSEGTRDQLYLALRLAALGEFAARADPLPFICDDLLVSFDDARAGLGSTSSRRPVQSYR